MLRIGKNGTLIMPAYVFEKEKNFVFNKIDYNFKNMGLLSSFFFKKKGVIRSNSPIHSHIGIGRKKEILEQSLENQSTGKLSDFYYMHKNNFKLILIGCDFNNGGSFIHYVENMNNVTYRKKIQVIKNIRDKNNSIRKIKVNYFAKKNKYLNYNFNELLKENNKKIPTLIKVDLKFGSSYSVNLKDLFKYVTKKLKKNEKLFIN